MDCASCAATVEKSVARIPGVREASVNFAAGRLDARHDPSVSRERFESAVEGAGYKVAKNGETEAHPFWKTPRAIALFVSGSLFAAGLVFGLAGAAQTLTVALYLAAMVVGGAQIFKSALAGLRSRRMDMNVLMSIAAIGGAAIGEWAEAASIVVLFAAGNALQTYAVDRTRGAVRALAKLAPDEVMVDRDGVEKLVPSSEVEVGEIVVVRPGERVALDGEVVEGNSALDESPITGESVPVEKAPGDTAFSGSLNGRGALLIRVSREAKDSTLQRIVGMVEDAQSKKAPSEQFVDRFSRVYTPAVVAVAVALAVAPPLLGGSFSEWVYRSLALLIIACPCALVISTPVTVVSGIGAASRLGALIKSGSALEAAGKLEAIAFDKTGTLTEGRPVLSSIFAPGGKENALALAAALEKHSEHPLAHAIFSAADGLELPRVEGFQTAPGRGAEGLIGGVKHLVGSPRLFEERGIPLDGAEEPLAAVEAAGETPVILGDDSGRVIAVLGLVDAIRPDAKAALDALRKAGVKELVMLTGDAEAPARRISEKLGISYKARLLPDQKVEAVRSLVEKYGNVGMVGDGINDAPALATASVGFAMGAAGTDVALETADIALMKDDLPKLAQAVALSRRAEGIIKQNVAVSLAIKGVFVLLAPFGFVALWLAVLADMGTSLAVTLNGLRLFRQRSGKRRKR
ncbi:MAG: cadmium-translocating P-type ATPase [Rubrobacter sp.]|nr:cadmium-translocating P-type ATPase [Rubrobacter sp.]